MIWNDHSKLEGLHAFLGGSNYHWINWSDETFVQRYYSQFSTTIGTTIHDLARHCISKRIKINKHDKNLIEYALTTAGVPRNCYKTDDILLNLLPFVNDAIGYRMEPEIILYYSYNCFGTCDAISYNEKEKTLRIHDLKTGVTPAHIEQLYIYAALFCLEYHKKPKDIVFELRIYQNFQVLIDNPEFMVIEKFMSLIETRNQGVLKLLESDGN